MVSAIVLKENILLSFTKQQTFDYTNIPFYVLLGLIIGFITIYYARWFQKIEHFLARYTSKPYKKALIGASVLAVLIFIIPTLFGEGYESIKILSESDPGILLQDTLFSEFRENKWVLLAFVGAAAFLKVFATGFTIGGGGNGGNFAPSLFLGSYVGYFFAQLITLSGLTKLPVSNFTIVGMAGVLSGLFHAPLTAIFLIAEITGGYSLMIPLMIGSSISFAVSKRFEKHSMDVKHLAKRGQVFTSNKDSNILSTIDTNSIIESDYFTISPDENLEKLVDLISHSNQVIFAVVNQETELLGIVHFNNIREIIFSNFKVKYTTVKEIMHKPEMIVYPFDNMEVVMKKFEESKMSSLPVVKNGKYYGFISKSVALESYRTKLKSMTIE